MSAVTLSHADGSAVVTAARVQIPSWGRWWADVDTQDQVTLDEGTAVTLALADASLVGTVVFGGTAYGRAAYRIVAGAGGWGQTLSARAYRDDAGVEVAAVANDAASECGETITDVPAGRTGYLFARAARPASTVLNALWPRGWYVDFAGVTRVGARAAVDYVGDAIVVDRLPGANVIELAAENDVATLVPGVSVDAFGPAVDAEWRLAESRLTARLYASPASDSRELAAFRALFDALDPHRHYRGVYEYRVVTQSGSTLNLQPVRSSAGVPDLERVPARFAPGVEATHTLGSLVCVAFIDSDPSRPAIVAGPDPDDPGWMPTFLRLGEGATLGVARVGDTVVAGPYAGTITSGSARILAGS